MILGVLLHSADPPFCGLRVLMEVLLLEEVVRLVIDSESLQSLVELMLNVEPLQIYHIYDTLSASHCLPEGLLLWASLNAIKAEFLST